MEKQKAQLIIILAIVVVFLFGLRFIFILSSRAKLAGAVIAMPAPKEPVKEAASVEYTGGSLRDPLTIPPSIRAQFAPKAAGAPAATSAGQLNLQGIIWEPIPTAVINDKLLKKGDKAAGATILEIRKDGIVILSEGKEVFIKLRRR